MKKQFYVGIDISAKTLDVCVSINPGPRSASLLELQVANTIEGLNQLFKRLKALKINLEDCWFCAEHTGNYSLLLCSMLEQKKLLYSLVPPLEIKRSLGITRGKNDQVDAHRIACYAATNSYRLKASSLPDKEILTLKELLTYRSLLVQQKVQNENSLKAHEKMSILIDNQALQQDQVERIDSLKASIKMVEEKIEEVIAGKETLQKTYHLVTSVKGIGLVTGAYLIASTRNFTAFDSWRKYSCYCGLAPFENSSGNVKGRPRLSTQANKQIKALLINGANSAMNWDPELKAFAQRKFKAGKEHNSVAVMIGNKLISRAFATVKRGTPYVLSYEKKINLALA